MPEASDIPARLAAARRRANDLAYRLRTAAVPTALMREEWALAEAEADALQNELDAARRRMPGVPAPQVWSW